MSLSAFISLNFWATSFEITFLPNGANATGTILKCAIIFEEVTKAESKNINQKNKNKKLECLAIESTEVDKGYRIKFFFSGDSIITITSETLEVTLNDIGHPWNVKYAPKHKI